MPSCSGRLMYPRAREYLPRACRRRVARPARPHRVYPRCSVGVYNARARAGPLSSSASTPAASKALNASTAAASSLLRHGPGPDTARELLQCASSDGRRRLARARSVGPGRGRHWWLAGLRWWRLVCWRRVTRMSGSIAGAPPAAVLAMRPSGETITAEGVPLDAIGLHDLGVVLEEDVGQPEPLCVVVVQRARRCSQGRWSGALRASPAIGRARAAGLAQGPQPGLTKISASGRPGSSSARARRSRRAMSWSAKGGALAPTGSPGGKQCRDLTLVVEIAAQLAVVQPQA